MPATALNIDHITHAYNGNTVLDRVSLKLDTNGFFTLLGPSGCGKTTLLRIISGLETPDEGSIWVENRQVCGNGSRVSPRERGVSMIFQRLALWPHLTVYENIELGLKANGIPHSKRKAVIDNLLERFFIHRYAMRFPHTLSVGEQQRVALCRALALKPRVLLLDEPFSHLDWMLKEELIELIKGLDATVLMVTHDQMDALKTGGTLGIMNDGKILQTGSCREVVTQPATEFVDDYLKPLRGLINR